ncbi:MAG TPA: hypothetical protein DEF36_18505 [Desulfotomaculum sp.]|nr:hypothetical protein [Desulfotomaculum sp.]
MALSFGCRPPPTVLLFLLCFAKWKGDMTMNEPSQSLPAFYDDNMIGFFPQGPCTIFVYWELSRELWEAVAQMGGAFIRLYSVWENGNSEYEYHLTREIKPPPYTGNWYFEELSPGAMYCFEVGGKLADGSFFPMLKSETVGTPPVPRFHFMPGQGPAAGEPGSVWEVPGEKCLEEAGQNLDLDEVLASMPFYMGYRKPAD